MLSFRLSELIDEGVAGFSVAGIGGGDRFECFELCGSRGPLGLRMPKASVVSVSVEIVQSPPVLDLVKGLCSNPPLLGRDDERNGDMLGFLLASCAMDELEELASELESVRWVWCIELLLRMAGSSSRAS